MSYLSDNFFVYEGVFFKQLNDNGKVKCSPMIALIVRVRFIIQMN